jgi:endonuclease/exonuclease/phosphatase family metal-dependent hydrolase
MLKLITWNIQSARTRDGGADWGLVVEALHGFADFDILCLQEVSSGFAARDGSDGGDGFAALAARLPDYHAAAALALDLRDADGSRRRLGCMSFSRWPVRQVLRHSLPWPADPAVPSMPRTVLELGLETPLGSLRVLNAHLEYFSETQRLAQVERLRVLQQEACAHAAAPRPGLEANGPFAAIPRAAEAVLAGDFNMLPGSTAHVRLLAPFDDGTPAWHDAWALVLPHLPSQPQSQLASRRYPATVGLHGKDTPFTFDYAFVSAGLAERVRAVRVDGGARGSDHQPVLLELG